MNDIVNEIVWKDLDQIVLVGHSYSGFVITGVAEQLEKRIASIVYLDALIPSDGQSFADLGPGLDRAVRLTPAPLTAPGDDVNEADRAWVDIKATPQPTATFTERLRVTGAYQRIRKETNISPTNWQTVADIGHALRTDPSWTVCDVESGHDVAIDAPAKLAELLEAAI